MENRKKKLASYLSLGLALSMALSSCNQDNSNPSKESNGSSSTAATQTETDKGGDNQDHESIYKDVDFKGNYDKSKNVPDTNPKLPLTDNPVTYNVMITYSLGVKDPNDMELYKQRSAETGVNLKYEWVLETAKEERVATTLASGDFPDIFVDLLGSSEILEYGDGTHQFLELSDYATNKDLMPNLAWILEQEPQILKASRTVNGNLYGVPAPNYYSYWPGEGTYIRTTQIINKTWLDKLGLDIPETTDEFVDVLTAFKEKDPNGNGKADEIPYSFQYSSGWAENFDSTIFGPFGLIGPGTSVSVEDGKAVFAIQQDGYKEAIKYANELWSKGLIDPEAFTQDADRYRAKGNAETPVYGVVNGWTGSDEVGDRVAMEAGGQYEYVPFAPLKGPEGKQIWKNEISGISANRAVFSADVEDPELLMRYIDYLYSPDQSIQEVYGMFEHQTEKISDGAWGKIPAPEGWNVEEWLRDTTTRRMPSYISSNMAENIINSLDEDGKPLAKDAEFKYQVSSVYAPFAQDLDTTMPAYAPYTEEELDTIARLKAPVTDAIMEQEVKWIQGEGDIEAEYDGFIKSLEDLGIKDVLAQYQSALDRWNKN